MSGRGIKVSHMMRKEIADVVISEIKDPRVGFVTITNVTMHDDLKQATVYFSVLGDEKNKEDAIKGLNSAASYIRRVISKRVHLKTIPEIVFIYDDIFSKDKRINDIINKIHEEKDSES